MKILQRNFFSVAFLLLASAKYLIAQQDPQFSQHFFNPATYNPAYAGMENALSATAQFRSQWVGVSGHPLVQNLNAHAPVTLLHGGIGINILNDQEGALRNSFLLIDYSFISHTKHGNFSFGISGGIVQSTLDGTKLRSPEGDYQNQIDHHDNILPVVSVSGFAPNFGAGFFYSGKNLNGGISVNHLLPIAVKMNSGNLETNFERHYYLQLAYLARISSKINLRPALIAKTNDKQFQVEADMIAYYNNFLWVGAGYRGYNSQTCDAIIGTIGFRINENLRVGYSYDYNTSSLSSVNSGSHEVVLNYRINLIKTEKPGKIIYTPRY